MKSSNNTLRWTQKNIKAYLSNSNFNQLNQLDNNGLTAFLYACNKQNYNLIMSLLKHPEIDINKKSSNNQTAVGFTQLGFLNASGYDVDKLVKKLISHPKFDINAQNMNGYTLLMSSILTTLIDSEKILDLEGIDIEKENADGETAFLMACLLRPELIEIFLEKGADPYKTNKSGQDAFKIALKEETGRSHRMLNKYISRKRKNQILSEVSLSKDKKSNSIL